MPEDEQSDSVSLADLIDLLDLIQEIASAPQRHRDDAVRAARAQLNDTRMSD